MKILLVTGATGHVGAEVAQQAAAAGLAVLATHAGPPGAGQAVAFGPTVTWAACDLADATAVARLASDHPIDACIHLAAISNEAYAHPAPLTAFQINAGATANLLDAARRHGWRRFILTGTGSVFQGETNVANPILEDATPSPSGIYATTKHCAELLVRMYRSQFGLSAANVRLSWVFGPPIVSDSPARGPIPWLLRRTLAGQPVRMESGADFAASFTYVADAAAGLLACARAPALNFDTYHLGHGVNFSNRAVAAALRAAVPGAVVEMGPGTEPWTIYTSMRGPLAGERLRREIGFAPAHSLEAGIAAYAQWLGADPARYRDPPDRPGG
ncbi:MAG: SDR family oxidoreductase [Alphaproteobacteria bacterium]|nr:SDR family oxidoreductase [Alphaproteobacteria bacterium]